MDLRTLLASQRRGAMGRVLKRYPARSFATVRVCAHSESPEPFHGQRYRGARGPFQNVSRLFRYDMRHRALRPPVKSTQDKPEYERDILYTGNGA